MIKNLVSLALCAAVFGAPSATTRPASDISAEKAMKRKVRKIVIKDSLQDAIAKYSSLAGVKIEVDWTALQAAGVGQTTRVALKMSDVPVGELLDLTLVQIQTKGKALAWYIDRNVVRVTTQPQLMHRDVAVPRTSPLPRARERSPRRVRVKEWTFDNTAVSDVFEVVRKTTGVNTYVNWRALQELGIKKDTPITLRASKISTARALDLITDELSGSRGKLERVYWLVDDGVLTISTGAALNRQTFTRVFYVADLLTVIPSFEGRRMGVSSGRGRDSYDGTGIRTDTFDEGVSLGTRSRDRRRDRYDRNRDTETTSIAEQREKLRENLTNIIKLAIGEEMWHPQGQGSVQFLRNKMVISQTKLGFLLMGKALRRR